MASSISRSKRRRKQIAKKAELQNLQASFGRSMSALGESASRGSMIGSTVGQLAPLIYGSLKGGSLLAGLGMALNPWAAVAI